MDGQSSDDHQPCHIDVDLKRGKVEEGNLIVDKLELLD